MELALLISLNFSAASGLSGFLSGWCLKANFLKTSRLGVIKWAALRLKDTQTQTHTPKAKLFLKTQLYYDLVWLIGEWSLDFNRKLTRHYYTSMYLSQLGFISEPLQISKGNKNSWRETSWVKQNTHRNSWDPGQSDRTLTNKLHLRGWTFDHSATN